MQDGTLQSGVIADITSVRERIDALDVILVDALSQRLALIRRASELKRGPEEARVPWRVEDVVTKVRAHALAVGFDADVAERIWRGMMEECIAYEARALAVRKANANSAL